MIKQTISWKNISLIIGLLLALAAYKFISDLFFNNVNKNLKSQKFIYIKSNQSFDRLIYNLQNDSILLNVNSFERLSKLLGRTKNIKPGRYKIEGGMSNLDIIRTLTSGKQTPLNLVIKYAKRKENLASIIAKQLDIDSTEFVNYLNDSLTQTKTKLDSNNIISLFVPNTYNIYWNTSVKTLVERMQTEYNTFWSSTRIVKCLQLKLNPLQVANLASIVMSETNKADEMPIVAGVYLNRIKLNMPLQADPTLLFAINDTSIKRVLQMHTQINSPYNTYSNVGLPPGPICTASATAIDAVLNAPAHNYLYFCAKPTLDGYHSFSETYNQHLSNAAAYQRELNKRGY